MPAQAKTTAANTTSTTTGAASTAGPAPTRDLFQYLSSLPPSSLRRLYAAPDPGGPAASRAVLQRLPELGGQFVLRLASCGGEFPLTLVRLWSTGTRGRREADAALRRMERLGIIEPLAAGALGGRRGSDAIDMMDLGDDEAAEEKKKDEDESVVRLTPEYRVAIQASLASLKSAPWDAVPREVLMAAATSNDAVQSSSSSPPTANELETYTQRRWDSVLHFLVGSAPDDVEDPPSAVVRFLEQTGLMQDDPEWSVAASEGFDEAPLVITSKGYEFMLQDVRVQVWQFILQYFQSLENHKRCEEIRSEALLFLICLSFCRVGEAYPASALSAIGQTLMKDFSQFGLLYVADAAGGVGGKNSKVFYPTRVAVNLVAGGLDDDDDEDGGGGGAGGSEASAAAVRALEASLNAPRPSRSHVAIIVQTNFQLCAYTTSELHVSMLGLFCDITNYRRLPNVIFYRITRESIKSAFKLGIEAGQILRFLRMHAHPRLRTGDQPLVPSNVEDQIWLWDRERHRVKLDEVYNVQCRTGAEFNAVAQYAADIGAYVWGSEAKLRQLVRYSLAERVLAFLRRWRSREAARAAKQDEPSKRGHGKAQRQTSYG